MKKDMRVPLILLSFCGLLGSFTPVSAVESLAIKVMPLEVGNKDGAKHSAPYEEAARLTTKLLRQDLSKLKSVDQKDLNEQLSESTNAPADEKLPKPKPQYPLQSPLKTPVCVVVGRLVLDSPDGTDKAEAAKHVTGAHLDLDLVDLTTQAVIDKLHVETKLAQEQALPDAGAMRKAGFESTDTGKMLHSLVADAIKKLDTMMQDSTTKLGQMAAKAKHKSGKSPKQSG